jgi:hypothetical protein
VEILGKNCYHPVYIPKNEIYNGHNINWKEHEFQVSENETLRETTVKSALQGTVTKNFVDCEDTKHCHERGIKQEIMNGLFV